MKGVASTAYITLANSSSSLSKKFRVLMGTLQKVITKVQNRRRTLTGKSDSQEGAQFASGAMTLRVHATDDLTGYGPMAKLETLYALNNPSATPPNNLTFTDN
jgi:hypothetical protein